MKEKEGRKEREREKQINSSLYSPLPFCSLNGGGLFFCRLSQFHRECIANVYALDLDIYLGLLLIAAAAAAAGIDGFKLSLPAVKVANEAVASLKIRFAS
jgi:hypothetical protein